MADIYERGVQTQRLPAEEILSIWYVKCGVIPGPSEPKLHLNTYLKPIVDDLQQLSNGIII